MTTSDKLPGRCGAANDVGLHDEPPGIDGPRLRQLNAAAFLMPRVNAARVGHPALCQIARGIAKGRRTRFGTNVEFVSVVRPACGHDGDRRRFCSSKKTIRQSARRAALFGR